MKARGCRGVFSWIARWFEKIGHIFFRRIGTRNEICLHDHFRTENNGLLNSRK